MDQVLISYRRDDAAGYVRALMSDMKHAFGIQQVFLDMQDIDAGSNFVSVIEKAVSHCVVLMEFERLPE